MTRSTQHSSHINRRFGRNAPLTEGLCLVWATALRWANFWFGQLSAVFLHSLFLGHLIQMDRNYQDGKYALSVSLFVRFLCELESKGAISEPNKKHSVENYNKESNEILSNAIWFNLIQLTINDLWKGQQIIQICSFFLHKKGFVYIW